jgi:alkylation response protein AidB-like acyl-CoA dehydrogenase
MTDADGFVLRYADFALSDEQDALQAAFRTFFEKHCNTERVRAAEPLGWDPALWDQLHELRPSVMGVAEGRGGDGAGLVELAVVAEEVGRHAAPVPLVETMVAARLLASVDDDAAGPALERIFAGDVASIAVARSTSGPQLVPGGAVAPIVVGLRDDALVLLADEHRAEPLANLGCAPLGWLDLAGGVEILTGTLARTAFAAAKDEWRILTAAALVGLGDAAEALAVQYAKDRHAFGAAIGSFQAIAHPLVDAAIGIESARRLVHRAAWFADHEPGALAARASIAFVQAAEAAEQAGAVAVHTQGGFGFTLESDVQLFFRRAKGWALVAGDRRGELRQAAGHLVGASASDDGGRS